MNWPKVQSPACVRMGIFCLRKLFRCLISILITILSQSYIVLYLNYNSPRELGCIYIFSGITILWHCYLLPGIPYHNSIFWCLRKCQKKSSTKKYDALCQCDVIVDHEQRRNYEIRRHIDRIRRPSIIIIKGPRTCICYETIWRKV